MQKSQDIVILDNDSKEKTKPIESEKPVTIDTNTTKLNLQDILSKSSNYAKKHNQKNTQKNNSMKNVIKNESKMKSIGSIKKNETEKQEMIHIIQRYQSSTIFGEYITKELKIDYDDTSLNKKNIHELDVILTKIRLKLDNMNLDSMYDNVLFGSTKLVETLSKPVVNVDGFSKMLEENQQFVSCWERLKCETVMPTIPPYLQMLLIVSQTYFLAYATNKMNEPSKEIVDIITDVEREIAEEESRISKSSDSKSPQNTNDRISKSSDSESLQNANDRISKSSDSKSPPKFKNGMSL